MNITCGHVHYEYTFSLTIKERQSFEIDLTSRATGQTKAQQTLVRINGCEPIISDMSWNEKFSQKFAKFCCHLWKVADSIDPHKADDLPESDPDHRKACPISVHQVQHIPWKGSTWNHHEFFFTQEYPTIVCCTYWPEDETQGSPRRKQERHPRKVSFTW